jgi:hypothetical protein
MDISVDFDIAQGQYYKTFYIRNLQMFIISKSVCPWQGITILSITTLNIATFSKTTLSLTTLNITTFTISTPSITMK